MAIDDQVDEGEIDEIREEVESFRARLRRSMIVSTRPSRMSNSPQRRFHRRRWTPRATATGRSSRVPGIGPNRRGDSKPGRPTSLPRTPNNAPLLFNSSVRTIVRKLSELVRWDY